MIYKKIKINAKKQDNGIYGMPLNCVKIDSIPFVSNDILLLHSAIVIALDEKYNSEFEILLSDKFGFCVYFNNNYKYKNQYRIKYNLYELVDDTLLVFNNENDHIIYLRKIKLKNLYGK